MDVTNSSHYLLHHNAQIFTMEEYHNQKIGNEHTAHDLPTNHIYFYL